MKDAYLGSRYPANQKGHKVWSVSPDTPVYDALKLMLDKNIGSLAVLEGDSLVGIFTERGHCRDVTLRGKFAKRTRVQEVMAQELVCVGLHTTVEECMTLMTYKRIRHLPALDDARLVGIVSIGDVVKAVSSDEKFPIDQLERYITSMP